MDDLGPSPAVFSKASLSQISVRLSPLVRLAHWPGFRRCRCFFSNVTLSTVFETVFQLSSSPLEKHLALPAGSRPPLLRLFLIFCNPVQDSRTGICHVFLTRSAFQPHNSGFDVDVHWFVIWFVVFNPCLVRPRSFGGLKRVHLFPPPSIFPRSPLTRRSFKVRDFRLKSSALIREVFCLGTNLHIATFCFFCKLLYLKSLLRFQNLNPFLAP